MGNLESIEQEHKKEQGHTHHHKAQPHDGSITIAASGLGVVITTISGSHSDATNNPGDPAVRISVYPTNPSDNARLTAAVIGGREHDCVYGYAVVEDHCFRSPCWQDTTPGVLDLNGVTWLSEWSFKIDGRGTMKFNGIDTWQIDFGSGGATYGDGGIKTTTPVF